MQKNSYTMGATVFLLFKKIHRKLKNMEIHLLIAHDYNEKISRDCSILARIPGRKLLFCGSR